MTRAEALARLRAAEPELRAMGVTSLSLFGSTARDEAGPDSDVDVVATFDYDSKIDLLGFAGIQIDLSEKLGVKVDLVSDGGMKPRFRARVEQDQVLVF